MDRGLRLVVFDRTCGRPSWWQPLGLSHIWRAGTRLYRRLGRIDEVCAAATWAEALTWLAEVRPGEPIAEVQLWSHGKWGRAQIGGDSLDRAALRPGHPLHGGASALRERLLPGGESLLWLRTCESFGAHAGHDFARALVDFFDCRAAGHTYVIAFYQSGLHVLRPGEQPRWPVEEGLRRGTAAEPLEARWSQLGAPHTITCLHGRVPDDF